MFSPSCLAVVGTSVSIETSTTLILGYCVGVGWHVHVQYPMCSSVNAALDAGEEPETDCDLMLAQMLQMQFDKEFDTQLRTEEKKLNGDSKRKPMNISGIRTIQGSL